MAVYRPSQSRQQKSETGPREPNLVPIMNLFITIIPFLLMMVVISQAALIGLNFETAGGDGSGSGGSGPGGGDRQIEIRLYDRDDATGLFLGFETRDLDKKSAKYPYINGGFDFISMQAALEQLKTEHPDRVDIAVIVYPEVLYDNLIRTIDLCKQSGFVNVKYMTPRTMYYY